MAPIDLKTMEAYWFRTTAVNQVEENITPVAPKSAVTPRQGALELVDMAKKLLETTAVKDRQEIWPQLKSIEVGIWQQAKLASMQFVCRVDSEDSYRCMAVITAFHV